MVLNLINGTTGSNSIPCRLCLLWLPGRYITDYAWHGAFISPCIAKLGEREAPGVDDAIDFVLTFEKLKTSFSAGIDLALLSSLIDGALPDRPGSFRLKRHSKISLSEHDVT